MNDKTRKILAVITIILTACLMYGIDAKLYHSVTDVWGRHRC